MTIPSFVSLIKRMHTFLYFLSHMIVSAFLLKYCPKATLLRIEFDSIMFGAQAADVLLSNVCVSCVKHTLCNLFSKVDPRLHHDQSCKVSAWLRIAVKGRSVCAEYSWDAAKLSESV